MTEEEQREAVKVLMGYDPGPRYGVRVREE